MVVEFVTTTSTPATPLKVTVAPDAKSDPEMVTTVPPDAGPEAGVTLVMSGGVAACAIEVQTTNPATRQSSPMLRRPNAM